MTIDEMAIQYAMLAPEGYQSGLFALNSREVKQNHIKEEMTRRFGAYATQEAIKRAMPTIKLIGFHDDFEEED